MEQHRSLGERFFRSEISIRDLCTVKPVLAEELERSLGDTQGEMQASPEIFPGIHGGSRNAVASRRGDPIL